MKLISDALPGSGEGLAGFIDTDIVFDENGIPYIPAKRIKGILRESALELSDAGLLNSDIIDIFGEQGKEKGCGFRISNGFLKDYHSYCRLIKHAKYRDERNRLPHFFNKESALDYFTYIRSQTKIDCEKGAAQDKSLRINRVLKKGLEFHFQLQFDTKYEKDLKNILKVTRFFGHNRTRGMGHIKMSLLSCSASCSNGSDKSNTHQTIQTPQIEDTESSQFNDDTLCCIPYEVKNIDHLMISTSISDRNSSLNYISGSCILGALAYKYLDYLKSQAVKDPGSDSRFRNIFISGVVSFSPAYAADDFLKEDFYPAPLAFAKQKNRKKYYNCADKEQWEKFLKLEGKTESLRGYVSIYSEAPKKHHVKTEVLYHHSRPEDKSIGHAKGEESGEGGEFFQLEAIAPGQTFTGEIMGPYKYLKELYNVIKPEPEMELFFGKSKTAQYGKVKLCFDRIFDVNEDAYTWKQHEEIAINLLSDMITVNSFGFAVPDIELFVKEFSKKLKVDSDQIRISRSFLNGDYMGGYMGVWNLPKPQYPAISAGSTVVLINAGKNITKDKMQEALKHRYGIKNEEGYGMIDVLPSMPITVEPQNPSIVGLNDVSAIKPFVRYILDKAFKNSLKSKAIEKANKNSITPSFLGRLKLIISNSSTPDELCGKISRFKKRAADNRKKLDKQLFLNVNDPKNIKLSLNVFSNTVKTSWCAEILTNHNRVIEESGLKQDDFFTPEALFKLYKSYALDLITFLQLKNRGK